MTERRKGGHLAIWEMHMFSLESSKLLQNTTSTSFAFFLFLFFGPVLSRLVDCVALLYNFVLSLRIRFCKGTVIIYG